MMRVQNNCFRRKLYSVGAFVSSTSWEEVTVLKTCGSQQWGEVRQASYDRHVVVFGMFRSIHQTAVTMGMLSELPWHLLRGKSLILA